MPKHRPIAKKKKSVQPLEPPFTAEIKDLTSDGRGVARHPGGRTFFVPGVWPGEVAQIECVGRQGKVGLGRVTELQRPHAQRRPAPCAYHGQDDASCGGCAWIFMSYQAQCFAKQQRLEKAVAGLGATDVVVEPLLAAPEELGYRNRAQFKTDGRHLGYVARESRTLVDVAHCPVLSDGNGQQLTRLRNQLPNSNWRGKRGSWRTIDIDDQTAEVSIDKRQPFRQGNDRQNAVMRRWLAEVISGWPSTTPVTELFAGSGNLTEVLLQQFDTVTAMESHEGAASVLAGQYGARVNSLCVDLYSPIAVARCLEHINNTQVLVLDPPREGLKLREPFISELPELRQVVYLSCDLATWARDAADFIAAGLALTRITPLDLFPQTPHLEVLSVFSRD